MHVLFSRTLHYQFRPSILDCRPQFIRYIHTSYALYTSDYDSDDSEEFTPFKRKPFFDLRKFREYLKIAKQNVEKEEWNELLKKTIREPPQGWTVETFLEKSGIIDENHLDTFKTAFPTWESLMLWTPSKTTALAGTESSDRIKLKRKIELYLRGLWPIDIFGSYLDTFQAPPLKNENAPWTETDDSELLHLTQLYDVDFGDPWIYISWKMQRSIDDIHHRYVQHILIPKNIKRQCELSITNAAKPLRVNRHFTLDPPFVFIIPHQSNFPNISNKASSMIPHAFAQYRRSDCFCSRELSTDQWEVGNHEINQDSNHLKKKKGQGRKHRHTLYKSLWKQNVFTDTILHPGSHIKQNKKSDKKLEY